LETVVLKGSRGTFDSESIGTPHTMKTGEKKLKGKNDEEIHHKFLRGRSVSPVSPCTLFLSYQ
jgi:hypothetical protein